MTVQQQLRISEADGDSINALLQDYLNSAIEEEGNEQPCGKIDPYRFWVDFASESIERICSGTSPGFLHQYVVNSEKERVVLGPEERAMIRTLNSAYSVIEVWRRLVASADFKVLRGERRALRAREKYLEAERLFLRWEQEGEKRDGHAYLIVKWSLVKLSPTLNLEINTLYVKLEATTADIIIILRALYKRAEDIPATPLVRLSFHAAVLQAATGGAVFETDYQTGVVRANLASLAFGPKAVQRDELLFKDLRSMTLTRDEGAPISVSEERLVEFQKRRDIAKFRAEIQASTDKREKNRIYSQIASTIKTCTRLQLEEDRQAYFKEADRLRLQGLEPEPAPGRGGPGIVAPVAALLSRLSLRDEGEPPRVDTSTSEQYIDMQLQHLSVQAD
ncbi:hypothetical protein NEMBOFW57_004048 [Staphylotrichum longicolle]|uniref:Uncharacterized protein n=1 Tax=Staphylotrichum longicolle TaxID=669026 RepID=A0AAD4I398_9PEZI|nr:hypothetical protein NEMBOFW57_004048 [Staphylotrichum longicolle]